MKLRFQLLLSFLFIISFSSQSSADSFVNKPDVQAFIHNMVNEHRFDRQTLEQLFSQVQIQPQIITTMTTPYEAKPWSVYKKLFVNPQRIEQGVKFWQANHTILAKIEQQYGVPANIILAILGIETFYGQAKFKYRALDSLATLAFHYPPRAKYFSKELREYLLLTRELNINPLMLQGSYAGALGMPQFMPSSYRAYGVNLDQTAPPDLLHNVADSIASVANYLRTNGWQPSNAIATMAKGNSKFLVSFNPAKPQYTLAELIRKGIHPAGNYPANDQVGVLTLESDDGLQQWLIFHNFYVITRYNKSPLYAMAVYQLSQELAAHYRQEMLHE